MNKKIATIVGILVIIIVIAGLGCIDGDKVSDIADIAKMVPEETDILYYTNVQSIRGDSNLYDIYKVMKEGDIGDLLDELDIDIDDLDYIAGTGEVIITEGEFDLKELRGDLDHHYLDFDRYDYEGVEFWLGRNGEVVAISGDKLILGGDSDDVKDCIKVMKGEKSSAYDNEDVRDIINKLPKGTTEMVVTGGHYHNHKRTFSAGLVWVVENEDTLKIREVVKFYNEDEADDAKNNPQWEFKERDKFFDVDVNQSGKFLEFTAKMDIDNIGIKDYKMGVLSCLTSVPERTILPVPAPDLKIGVSSIIGQRANVQMDDFECVNITINVGKDSGDIDMSQLLMAIKNGKTCTLSSSNKIAIFETESSPPDKQVTTGSCALGI